MTIWKKKKQVQEILKNKIRKIKEKKKVQKNAKNAETNQMISTNCTMYIDNCYIFKKSKCNVYMCICSRYLSNVYIVQSDCCWDEGPHEGPLRPALWL